MMFEQIEKILYKYFNNNYAIIPNQDGTSSVVFFMPYQPYEREEKDKLFIDAYYKASNELYHKTNSLIEELNDNEIEAKRLQCNLKSLAIKSGLALSTHTTLVADKEYGTKIVLGAITIKGDYKLLRKATNLCTYCYECVRACPTGALTREGFDRDKCIRQLQLQSATCSDEYAQLIGNKLMGCDICQRACMLNAFVESQPIPNELEKYLDLDHLLACAYIGKTALAELEPFIGKNYLRPKKLLALALNAANNMKHYTDIDKVKELVNSDYKSISINAKRLLDSYNNRQ